MPGEQMTYSPGILTSHKEKILANKIIQTTSEIVYPANTPAVVIHAIGLQREHVDHQGPDPRTFKIKEPPDKRFISALGAQIDILSSAMRRLRIPDINLSIRSIEKATELYHFNTPSYMLFGLVIPSQAESDFNDDMCIEHIPIHP